ncbi:hypothetical protein LI951_03195 [Enterococcus sp. BWT-B8]|uniref:hypothetical protein n=1 Tax=Enterococcus sp. BWT-B8 TaxID=2885157 RepID=UPI001E3B3300|nr:hypothetical protein [Enterococcus sp. BWT-B8]MCB5951065.1 hypothetical protein [Enterococcus sp. BWT-B8]
MVQSFPPKLTTTEDHSEAEWVNKNGLILRFEGLNRNTLNVWLMEMRDTKEFESFVVNPTHKLVWINVEGFLKFLRWKAHERGY